MGDAGVSRQLSKHLDAVEAAIETERFAHREAAISKAKMEASADRLLKAMGDHSDPNKERGN